MPRSYHLSKTITQEQADEILREIRENPAVNGAEIDLETEGGLLNVDAAEENFPTVMSRAVNICRRVGDGCELTFAHFIYTQGR